MSVNKSKSYVLPLYSKYINIRYIDLIRNTYLFLEGKYDEGLIIEYINKDNEDFKSYLEEISTNEFVNEIIYKEDFIFVVLKLPVELNSDYYNFINGSYSKIKEKKTIVKFLSENYGAVQFKAINRINQVLNRDKALRAELEYNLDMVLPEDCELSSIPDKISETLIL